MMPAPGSTTTYCGMRRWRGVLVVLGGILVHLSLGTVYTFGNLNPYLTSFMRSYGSAPDLTYTECSWVFALAAMGQGASMAVGGLIEKRLGPKMTSLLGGWLMSLGVLLTYFAVKKSFAWVVITYGAVFGFGVGIAYAIPLGCAVRWFPEKKGLVNGLVVAGFGGGAFIFDQVQTAFINPDNLKTNKTATVNGESYFTQPSVLNQVPYVFLLLGGCYVAMQVLGSILICNPPPVEDCQAPETMEEEQERAAVMENNDGNMQRPLVESPPQKFNIKPEADDDQHMRPMEVLKTRAFYTIWFMFLFNGQGTTFISTLYKAYGQTFIEDDTFMAIVGSFAAVFNAGGRIMWGTIADKFSTRVALLIMNAAFTCLLLTLQLSKFGEKPLFFIYICLLFGCFAGSFALFPTATAKCFGKRNFSVNYGLVFTSQVITAPLGVFLSQSLKSTLGWDGLFFLVAGFSCVSFILAMFFNAKDKQGKEI